jgi:hypothetical protein
MLAFMAGPTLDSGQHVAYLQLFLLPYLLKFLAKLLAQLTPTPEEDIQCLPPGEFLALATPRETNSLYSQAPTQKEKTRREVLEGSEQQQIEDLDLPPSDHGFTR